MCCLEIVTRSCSSVSRWRYVTVPYARRLPCLSYLFFVSFTRCEIWKRSYSPLMHTRSISPTCPRERTSTKSISKMSLSPLHTGCNIFSCRIASGMGARFVGSTYSSDAAAAVKAMMSSELPKIPTWLRS